MPGVQPYMATVPDVREMIPDFVLPSSSGGRVQASSYRGRRDLVLVFIGQGGNENLLDALASANGELNEEETQVLVVYRGSVAQAEDLRRRLSLPFPVLADEDGQVHLRYAVKRAAVVITDRYGEIYSVFRQVLPDTEEILASLRHINAACPE